MRAISETSLSKIFSAAWSPQHAQKLFAHWNCYGRSKSSPRSSGRSSLDQIFGEVRLEYAGNIYRLLAAFAKGNRLILLHGFQKKSQKTPRQDMKIAQQRQKRYFQRHGYL
jgi:phage-related protein